MSDFLLQYCKEAKSDLRDTSLVHAKNKPLVAVSVVSAPAGEIFTWLMPSRDESLLSSAWHQRRNIHEVVSPNVKKLQFAHMEGGKYGKTSTGTNAKSLYLDSQILVASPLPGKSGLHGAANRKFAWSAFRVAETLLTFL